MYADDILATVASAERTWPHNAHLLEHHRIDDYVRLALKYRGDAMTDGSALIPPIGLSDDLHHDFVSYPFDDPASMLAQMDLCQARGRACGAPAFVCAVCSRALSDVPRRANEFELLWISAPPSIVGVALCATCAPVIIDDFRPVQV